MQNIEDTAVSKMNRPVIVVALVLACVFSSYGGHTPELLKALGDCRKQYNIEPDEIKDAIQKRKLPETENGQCFMSCVMEKMGVIKNGQIDLTRSEELNEFKDPENRQKSKEIAKICAKVQGTEGKPCSFATEVVKCFMKNAAEQKMDFSKEKFQFS